MVTSIDSVRLALAPVPVEERDGRVVASPGSTEEVASVLRLCHAEKLPVEISGAGTKRGWGGRAEAEVVLETARLRGVREHPWQDLTATVGAGTPWAEMQGVLAAHGQFVALDPLWQDRATVGGVLAVNDSGALRLRYGSARDLVIGMTLALADGTVAKTGGKVVKNVAGYDLHKLMIGAFGTLAVVTEVTFRLHPLPRYAGDLSVHAKEARQLLPALAAMKKSHLNFEGVQVRGAAAGYQLDLRLNARPETRHAELLEELITGCGLRMERGSETVWSAREVLFEMPLVIKAGVMQDDVVAFVKETAEKGGRCVGQTCGVMLAGFDGDERSLRMAEEFRSHWDVEGGFTTVLKRPADLPTRGEGAVAPGERASAFALMREVKRQFDSGRILNRGLMGGV